MNKLYNDNEIIDLIKNNNMVVLYFTGSVCGACEIIKIKIEDILFIECNTDAEAPCKIMTAIHEGYHAID